MAFDGSWEIQIRGAWVLAPFKDRQVFAGKKYRFTFEGVPAEATFSSTEAGTVSAKGSVYPLRKKLAIANPQLAIAAPATYASAPVALSSTPSVRTSVVSAPRTSFSAAPRTSFSAAPTVVHSAAPMVSQRISSVSMGSTAAPVTYAAPVTHTAVRGSTTSTTSVVQTQPSVVVSARPSVVSAAPVNVLQSTVTVAPAPAAPLAAAPAAPAPAPEPAEKAPAPWRVKLGAEMPNFHCSTTHGDFTFHEFLESAADVQPYTLLFSHPADFTPVCTTELGRCERLAGDFQARGVKLIGVSCDSVEDHLAWSGDILYREGIDKGQEGQFLSFPIIADKSREIVVQLGMLDPEEKTAAGVALPARAIILVGPDKKVKMSILYPATTGRNFDEIIRAIDSIQITADTGGLATPVDWRHGERVIVGPALKTEDAQARFQNFHQEELPSGKPYLRSVDCPVQFGEPAPEGEAPVEQEPAAPQ